MGDDSRIDHDEKRRERIAAWLKQRWCVGEDLSDTPQLLLDFERQLMAWEVKRMSDCLWKATRE